MDYLECGWPGSNPKDAEFFARAQSELSQEAKQKLVAFGWTRSKRSATADQDPQLRALVESGAPTACIVCKASSWQTTDILGASREDNLDMISSSVAFLRQEGLKVHVDLEHFYDGFLLDERRTATKTIPWNVRALPSRRAPRRSFYATRTAGTCPGTSNGPRPPLWMRCLHLVVGVHAHDDSGVAVANSLAAVRGGACLVQGTANGVGERTGNANLNAIIGALALKGSQIRAEGIDVACSSKFTPVGRFRAICGRDAESYS